MLNVPYDSKILKMALSHDEKLLALLLFNQDIYVFNLFTQSLFLKIEANKKYPFSTLTFLDPKN